MQTITLERNVTRDLVEEGVAGQVIPVELPWQVGVMDVVYPWVPCQDRLGRVLYRGQTFSRLPILFTVPVIIARSGRWFCSLGSRINHNTRSSQSKHWTCYTTH
uniref:Uncharacterized protein n=1 Tax=Cacopsylla melanoneura TaxID=428564 RepID=A0A8D9BLD1_9HEMI